MRSRAAFVGVFSLIIENAPKRRLRMVSASRSQVRIPSLRCHKASGQAVVTIKRCDIYCRTFGSIEAEQQYRRVIAKFVAYGPEVVCHNGVARDASQRLFQRVYRAMLVVYSPRFA